MDTYFLLTEREGRTGRILPELVRVNKKFIIWLCLTPNNLKSEPWRTGMNETVYRKAFKTQQFSLTEKPYIAQEKVKTLKETVSFYLASNYSNFLNQIYFNIFYIPALPAGH